MKRTLEDTVDLFTEPCFSREMSAAWMLDGWNNRPGTRIVVSIRTRLFYLIPAFVRRGRVHNLALLHSRIRPDRSALSSSAPLFVFRFTVTTLLPLRTSSTITMRFTIVALFFAASASAATLNLSKRDYPSMSPFGHLYQPV